MKIKVENNKVIIEFQDSRTARAFKNWFSPERKQQFRNWFALMGDIIR